MRNAWYTAAAATGSTHMAVWHLVVVSLVVGTYASTSASGDQWQGSNSSTGNGSCRGGTSGRRRRPDRDEQGAVGSLE